MLKQDQKKWSVCVKGVCVWTIWRDVKLLNTLRREQERHGKSPANEDTYHRRWYQTWPVWHTCTVVITCCSGFASFQFYFAISACEWQTAKPRTGKTICFSLLFCTVVAICKFLERGRVSFQFTLFCTGYGDGYFHCFSGPLSDLLWSG